MRANNILVSGGVFYRVIRVCRRYTSVIALQSKRQLVGGCIVATPTNSPMRVEYKDHSGKLQYDFVRPRKLKTLALMRLWDGVPVLCE